MGFNIQEYELAKRDGVDNNNWSNAAGYFCELIINKDKKTACESARNERKSSDVKNVSSDTALSKGVACVKGLPIYSPPIYLITSRNQRTQNRMICKARKEAKIKDDVPPIDAVRDNPASDAQAPTDATKSNTAMYIGIGIGVLAIGIVTIILIKKNK
jgi:hypothetical protein